ncbi:hypothetical protein EUTSA_v10020605mg [Eutrema salsugineum]|uniref:Amine oxidase domain-containing protein n=1 Tax=Eutrema salsugineum TaxID=72664 RepID=V4M400_EUTSA|nr:uncharacterized protein LOC18025251 [Eutrema salsugineum]ESQ49622.1 hypothetical protein EUTSA_v10020605mg [Eutrema salsugineum]
MATSSLIPLSTSFLQPLKFKTITKPRIPDLSTTKKPVTICDSEKNTGTSNPTSRNPNFQKRRKSNSSKYGTSRRSILKKSFLQEQVTFTARIPADPHVAIIGGGMAGLVCALDLEARGVQSTVFDTGIHGLGGRLGTRIIEPQGLIFDHAAQFFTANDSRFIQYVDGWLEKGLVREWKGVVGELEIGGSFSQFPPSSPPRYIAVNGMRSLADSLLLESQMVNLVRPCWISKLEPLNGMWHLSENGTPRGQFDVIVIAHNGKCANRLLSASGLPLVAKQMKKLDLSSIWALLAAFDEPLPAVNFEGAFVKGVESLSWMGNNSAKLGNGGAPHCWTFFSTAAYGKQNKVPQENIPAVTSEKVRAGMLQGVEIALGLPEGSLPKPVYTRLQLWGAALPKNTPAVPCIFDPQGRAGICGDWLRGSNLESAALSGAALGKHIADFLQNGGANVEEFEIGLHDRLSPLAGHDIGQFPGLTSVGEKEEAKSYQLL